MTTPLFNGTLAQIADQCQIVMIISSSGTEITTGNPVFNGTLAQISDHCQKAISVSASGTVLE